MSGPLQVCIEINQTVQVHLNKLICRELSLDMYNFYDGGEGVKEEGQDEIEVGADDVHIDGNHEDTHG